MPAGRQAHGKPLLTAKKTKVSGKKSKARSHKNALNAFGIAQEHFPSRQKKTPRARELDAESERKRARNDQDEGEDEEDEEVPRKKRTKGSAPNDADYGSDSEGNEWRMGALAEGHEDSEIESDDAFGDSDDDKFQGYAFRGSKPKKADTDDSEDDSNDDEGETLGADAIDLATALDQFVEDDDDDDEDEAPARPEKPEPEESDDDTSQDSDSSESEDDDQEADTQKLEALRGLVSEYGGQADEATMTQSKPSRKINLGDLDLAGIDDPFLKRSVKLMNKEDKEKRPGAAKKLDVPLPKRQQDRQDRAVAYEKTKETLDRWTETVKQNRRADHLIFPLPQHSATAGLDMSEMQPLSIKSAANELESTIMSIMEQSGLSLEKQGRPKPQEVDDEGNVLSRKEAMNRKRIQRELIEREAKRAKRIKKIKSKAYHRVHRKQRERDEMAAKEAMEEAGEVDSEAEREAQDRRRALERVGQRHKESKWAKLGSKTKRAVWDDDFRQGLTEMARKDEELRRRKEGRKGDADGSDSDTSSSSGDDDEKTLRRRLDELEAEGRSEPPDSTLMSMKFMQKAEAAKKKANDDLVQQIRRELDGEEAAASDSDAQVDEVGRRSYGAAAVSAMKPALDTSKRAAKRDEEPIPKKHDHDGGLAGKTDDAATTPGEATTTAGAWSRGEARRSRRKGGRVEELDLASKVLVAQGPVKATKSASTPKTKTITTTTKAKAGGGLTVSSSAFDEDEDDDDRSDDEDNLLLPPAIRDQDLLARAFAGEDVVADFEREKAAVADEDDDKVVDCTLPGWGSWVGDGISSKERSKHAGLFLTKIKGVKKQDRKDAKLQRVMISEKRVKKNDIYLASQLPHPFESRQQYERSLRLPIGQEWLTKGSFQDGTKPRLLMKQGVIAPMSKPTA
ncbi:hypothetical protein L249_2765 [Ophiocordyceps polyrhachis-furcata BCC 54312]|uniref:Uncharacterized protein n=1 Tax=Ophiocordyceps polyrhachis-furcata BCC 54312 TaxID=1330021 RepID=A0A367LR75_9HYPO|nr:hypothetical protein L249_2765 [Ophiocordyceps polyrhachis-furcata BCC 54312]